MKVLFIYPTVEPLGIEYLSAVLRKKGHITKLIYDPRLFDEINNLGNKFLKKAFSFRRTILKRVIDFKPGLICFSVITDEYRWACALSKEIKDIMEVPIIFGGIHVSSSPDEVIKEPFIDMICIGEGEEALTELVDNLEDGISTKYDIKNIWFKDKKGRVIKNEVRPLIDDLDSLPFADKELFYQECNFYKSVRYTIITTRGCLYGCSFCNNNLLRKIYQGKGRYVRRRSVDNVIKELSLAKRRFSFRFIRFEDEIFTGDIHWLGEFTEKYKRKIALPFFCWTHPATSTEETVKLLKDAGCKEVEMGVESVDKTIREEIFYRHTPNEQIKEAYSLLKEAGIVCIADHILGLKPLKEELLEVENFYKNKNKVFISLFRLRNYPGLEINEIMEKRGLLKPDISDKDLIGQDEGIVGIDMRLKEQDKSIVGLYNLILMHHLLPRKLLNFILESKLYCFFGVFNTRIIHFLCYRSVSKLSYERILRRYLVFGLKRIFTFFPRRIG